jgi:outer membrane protein OmpA-like peptidoglycan-associated protein
MRWMDICAGIVFSISMVLVGCAHPPPPPPETPYCQLLKTQIKLANHLQAQGIKVIQVGEETTLILSTDQFFYAFSNHMRQDAEAKLNHIVHFINTYPTVDVQVTGYTDNVGNYTRNLALSRAQAQAVVDYLWSRGLNSRMISASGKGCHEDIADNSRASGRAQNRRIEIYFRLPPPDNIFH